MTVSQMLIEYDETGLPVPVVPDEPVLVPENPLAGYAFSLEDLELVADELQELEGDEFDEGEVGEYAADGGEQELEAYQSSDEDHVGEETDPDSIPDSPGEYCMPSVRGFSFEELPELDIEFLKGYLDILHAGQVPQRVVSNLLTYFAHNRLNMNEYVNEFDRAATKEAKQTLLAEWGSQYQHNIALINAHLMDQSFFADGSGELFVSARTPDGGRLINNPHIAKYFARMATRSERYVEEEFAIDGNEIDELNELMGRDIQEFQWGKWRNTNMSPSDRLLQLTRKMEAA
jgi:hypothetical protein